MAFCGLDKWILRNITSLKYKEPTQIQNMIIPHILQNKGNIIGISKTGSGKTAAFCLPIINELAKDPTSVYAIIVEPTRELALQVIEKLNIYTIGFNLRTSLIIGGEDYIKQLLDLDKAPHIIVCTPGRLADLINNNKVPLIENVKYFVLDEFDQLFNDTMLPKVEEISSKLPKDVHNLLFSATFDKSKITMNLIHDSLSIDNKLNIPVYYSYDNNIFIEDHLSNVDDKEKEFIEKTVSTLTQQYLTVPPTLKELYLIQLLNKQCRNKSLMIFVQTCKTCQFLYELLTLFSYKVSAVHSKLSQKLRFSDLQKFKSSKTSILIATDLACRGLDIPQVDFVINFDLPRNPVDYIHRVGRTARAGKIGTSISFVTPVDVELVLEIEKYINKTLTELEFDEDEAMKQLSSVSQGKKMIHIKLQDNKKISDLSKKPKRKFDGVKK